MRTILIAAASAALSLAPLATTLAAPDQTQPNPAQMSPAPSAGTPSGATVDKAGAALRDLMRLDEKYQGQMTSASPEKKQTLNAQANAEAVQAIQSHGLSVEEYTNVIRLARNNPQVKQQLLNAAKSGE